MFSQEGFQRPYSMRKCHGLMHPQYLLLRGLSLSVMQQSEDRSAKGVSPHGGWMEA